MRLEARAVLAAALVAASVGAAAQAPFPSFASRPRSPERQAEIAQAEALLARGDAAAATQAYERLAGFEHTVDIELGIVRSQIQAGEFRRALAFAAHTAGAHGNDLRGAALYTGLLDISGQADFAERVRAQARTRAGAANAELTPATPLAPYASGAVPSQHARLAATGVLVDDGRRAIVPARAVQGAQRIWLRDGLGRTVEASAQRDSETPDLAVLALIGPLGAPADAARPAARDAFPGSPAAFVAYPAADDAKPTWPTLNIGFVGAAKPGEARSPLNIDGLAGLSDGGVVFDLSGRLIGLSIGGAGAERRLLPVSAWQASPDAATTPAPRLMPDAIYERALLSSVQVLVAR